MKWLSFIGIIAIFSFGCERHPVSTLNAFPGHHEAHGESHDAEHAPSEEHAPAEIPHRE